MLERIRKAGSGLRKEITQYWRRIEQGIVVDVHSDSVVSGHASLPRARERVMKAEQALGLEPGSLVVRFHDEIYKASERKVRNGW
jgi:hypothetical protein